MAKDDIDLDDINFDDDNWDMDFDIKPPKDDRNPVKKIASGAIKGVKSTLKDPQFIKKKTLQILPPGYSKAADLADEVGSELSDLYNSAAKELEPMRQMGTKALKSALPKLKGKLPKKIEAKLQDILDDAERSKTSFGVNQDEANMSLELGEIFKTQMEHQESIREKEELADRAKTAINFKQHKESITELAGLKVGIDKLVGYQDSINFKFQKKTLELQYRQYYAQRDLLELSKTTNKAVIDSLNAIMKNTALPEFVKVQTTETGKQMLRERMLKSVGGRVSDFSANYTKNFTKNIRARVQQELGALGSLASMGDMIDPESLREMGIDPMEELVGGTLGSGATNLFADSLIYRYKDRIPFKNKITKGSNWLSKTINDLPILADEYARSTTKGTGLKSEAVRMLKSLMPKFSMKTDLESDSIKTMDQATHFDSQTRKSIVEIIPGYLARILRSIDILRTGDESTDLVSYDLMSNSFVGKNELKKTLINRMFSKTNLERANYDTDYVLKHLESSGGELSPELKKLLKSQMLSDAQQNKRISVDRYLSADTYSSFVDEKSRNQLMKFFKGISDKGDTDLSFGEELSRRSMALKNSIPNTREMAQTFINAGYGDILRESGIVTKMGDTDNLDFNKVLRAYREGTDFLNEPSRGKGKKSRSGKKGNRNQFPTPPVMSILEPMGLIPEATQTQSSEPVMQTMGSELKSFLDDFKTQLFENLLESKKLDEERNIKLDEMILRLDGLGPDGTIIGPGSRSFRERAKSLGTRLKGTGGRVYDKVKGFTSKYLKLNKDVFTGAFNTAKNTIKGTLGGLKEALFYKIEDVYTPDDLNNPKLTAAKIRAGEYRDEVTKKVIKSVNDIKGRVIDKDGNIVIDLPDIQNGFVNRTGEKIKSFVSRFAGGTLDAISKYGGNVVNTGIELTKLPFKLLGKVNKLLSENNLLEADLYLPGEKDPRLFLAKLKAGEYYHGETLELLTSFKDIKDGVRDVDGNYVLTPEEASRGLKTPAGLIAFKPFKLIGSLASGAMKLGGKILKLNFNIVGGAAKLLGKGFSKLKGSLTKEDKQLLLLAEIRDILDDRLADQTVDRAGSVEDLMNKRKAKGKKEDTKGSTKDGKDKKAKDKEGGGLLDTLSDLTTTMGGLRTLMGGFGKLLGKIPGLGMVGRGLMSLGTVAAEGAISLVAGAATGTGIGGAIAAGVTGAVGLAGSAIAGVASILSAPVVLGAAAIAAVGYGGYKLYKYMKNKNAWLGKIRMAQYGLDPDDSDKVSKVGDLEGLLIKKLKASPAGYSIDLDKDTVEEVLDIFDIDEDDKKNMDILIQWFDRRFKPVFLAHAKATDRFAKGSSLIEVEDKVPLTSKLEYIKMVSFGAGEGSPYNVSANPFDGDNTLPVGETHPKKYIDEAVAYYKKELEKDGKSTGAEGKAVGAVAAKAALDVNGKPVAVEAPKQQSFLSKVGNTALQAAKITMMAIPGAALGLSIGSKILDFFKGKDDEIDAFTAVRMKAYGLKELNNPEQIKTLLTLEASILRKAKLAKDGGVSAPVSEQELLSEYAPKFGVNTDSATDVEHFFVWFKSRFLPVCLKYFSLVRTMEPMLSMANAAEKLKPSQKASIAKELVNVKVSSESGASIWTISISPFPGVEMNTDKSSCNGHIKYLENQTSEKEVKSQDMAVKKTPGQSTAESKSMMDSLKDKLKSGWGSVKDGAGALLDKAKDAYGKVVDSASRGMERTASAVGSAVQTARDAVGGAGFDFGSLPKVEDKPIKGDAKKNIGIMLKEMAAAGITEVKEKAMLLGQLSHESGGFTKLSESLKYSASRLMQVFSRARQAGAAAVQAAVAAGPSGIAELIYGGRMGNSEPGDGFKYRGRGFIQLTGKDNYIATGKRLGIDLVNNPDLASDPVIAAKIAIDYWKNRVGSVGKTGDLVAVTQKINGGTNGLQERGREYANYLNKFNSGELDKISQEAANDPVPAGSTVAVPPFLAKPDTTKSSAPPASIAKPQPQQQQTAVAGLMNMNPFDTSGLNGGGSSTTIAANTDAVNRTIESVTDKEAHQSNANQDYQQVSMDAQRKASSDYLNTGIDKVGGVLGEQLNVQKSIDTNIKQLVQLIQSGKFSQEIQSPQTTPVSDKGNQPTPQSDYGKTVRGPVSMRRTNV